MEAVHADPAALDLSLALADRIAARLAQAEAEGTRRFRVSVGRAGSQPVPLRYMREELRQLAAELEAGLRAELDAAWIELAALDQRMGARDQRLARAAWRALVRPWFLRVPFVRRTVDKPLGYAGDYGMVNHIYAAPGDSEDPVGLALEHYIWQVGPCRAHRQRRPWALGHLEEARRRAGRPLRVVSYACGPEHTLQAWVEREPDSVVDLYDAEPKALDWCRRRFGDLGRRLGRPLAVRTHPVSVAELAEGALVAAPADVVTVLGLFDYLDADGIARLVDRLSAALAPGGRLLCTNLNEPNPWRVFMDYLGEWTVEHRTRARLEQEVLRGRSDLHLLESRLDDSGTNVFLAVERLAGL